MNPQRPPSAPIPSTLTLGRGNSPVATPLLEDSLSAVETCLGQLGRALNQRDTASIDRHATELHRALARAVDQFQKAARQGGVPPALRRRLSSASGEVAAQRESLARATAALDRAMDVLLPRDAAGLYSAGGGTDRASSSGLQQA